MVVTEYKDRLAEALELAGVDEHALAKHLGVTYQAVKKVLDGRTVMLNAANNSKAARFLGVDSDWLATGDGLQRPVADDARGSRALTLPPVTIAQALHALADAIQKLDDADREIVLDHVKHLRQHPDRWARIAHLVQVAVESAVEPEAPKQPQGASERRETGKWMEVGSIRSGQTVIDPSNPPSPQGQQRPRRR